MIEGRGWGFTAFGLYCRGANSSWLKDGRGQSSQRRLQNQSCSCRRLVGFYLTINLGQTEEKRPQEDRFGPRCCTGQSHDQRSDGFLVGGHVLATPSLSPLVAECSTARKCRFMFGFRIPAKLQQFRRSDSTPPEEKHLVDPIKS